MQDAMRRGANKTRGIVGPSSQQAVEARPVTSAQRAGEAAMTAMPSALPRALTQPYPTHPPPHAGNPSQRARTRARLSWVPCLKK